MGTSESQITTNTQPTKIASLFAYNDNRVFNSLMHHINAASLRICFDELDGRKAIGADGISKEQYGENLQNNLDDLINRMKSMSYRPAPVREVLIPKEGKRNATRPLGISNFEDKLIQRMMQNILDGIYDQSFLTCSYGFRPGLNCHDTIKDLHKYLYANEVEVVIDVDLSNYFGSINRTKLIEFLQRKIKDTRFLRYISRMFKAGVLSNGELTMSDEGVVQGSCCSPILANVYAHHVIDLWFDEINQRGNRGSMRMFRYADDIVICCRHEEDAVWMKDALAKRLTEFDLTLNKDKTKLVKFSKRKYNQKIKQDAFNFLGFTFYLGKSRKGYALPKVKTIGTRLRSKLKKVNEWARENRNKAPLKDIWKTFCAKLRGHIQYYGVSFNSRAIITFRQESVRIMFKWLNRRSQKKSFKWEQFELFMMKYPPPEVVVVHHFF
jgi:RNA-directed DNA polymerase